MGIAWILLEIGLNGFDAAYIMSLSTDKNSLKSWVQRKHIVAFWLALVSVFCTINFLTNFNLMSIFLFPMLATLYPLLFNKVNALRQTIYLLLATALMVCIEFLVVSTMMNVYSLSLLEIVSNPDTRLQVIIIGKTVILLTWLYFLRQKKQGKNTTQDAFRTYIIIIFICSFSFAMFSAFKESFIIEGIHKFMFPFILLFVFISILLFLHDNRKKYQLEKQLHAVKERELEIDYREKVVNSYQASMNFYNKIIEEQREIWKTMLEIRNGNPNAMMKSSQSMRLVNERLDRQYCTGNSLVDTVIMIKEYEFSMHQVVLKVEGELTKAYIPEVSMIVDNLLSKAFNVTQEADKNDYMFPYIITIRFEYFNDEKGLVIEIEYPSRSIAPLPLDLEIKHLIEQLEGNITSSGWRSDSEGDYQATRIQLNQYQSDVK